jgi:putative phosphoesterase
MKLAIISDTHDNLAILEKAVKWMKENNIEEIIHCGDVCSPDTLQWLAENFPGKIHLVSGNADDNQTAITKTAAENLNIILCGESGKIKIADKKISFCHYPKLARELALTGQYNLVFYGHTHQPWEEKLNGCRLINPGNLSNMLYKASFAVYDTKTGKLELKILERL